MIFDNILQESYKYVKAYFKPSILSFEKHIFPVTDSQNRMGNEVKEVICSIIILYYDIQFKRLFRLDRNVKTCQL